MGREHAIGASRVDPLSVFLSYDRDDTQAAQSFVKALEAQGFSIWWDGLINLGLCSFNAAGSGGFFKNVHSDKKVDIRHQMRVSV